MMHREIVGLAAGDPRQVDHINGDGLDNRRSNLRLASKSQNMANSKKRMTGTSRYKGVNWNRAGMKWVATIRIDRKKLYLGRFDKEIDAAGAYNAKALDLFGDFARLNVVT